MHTVSEKIRYYRHKHLLHQRDVAIALNMERSVYQACEYDTHDYYPLETLKKLADFYRIPIENLMDEYHLFLYRDPGQHIRQFRKKYGYTQQQLADKLGVWRQSVRAWEKGYKKISKAHYIRLMKLMNNT